jgi:hypothetical protein
MPSGDAGWSTSAGGGARVLVVWRTSSAAASIGFVDPGVR